MNRGTLMVLKRLLVTTLGALGLGALAAGTASGQTAGEGNIPAPDIFDDQITCSMLVPTVGGMTAVNTPTRIVGDDKTSALDDLIDDGDVVIMDPGSLGYVIPPGGNCGSAVMFGAMDIDANNNMMVDDGDTVAAGDIPIDVAEGYSALLPLFSEVYGAPGGTIGGTLRTLTAAQEVLSDAIAAGSTGTGLTSAQNAVTRAQEAHNKAVAKFTDASAGPVYQAGVAEWMAKAAVTKSIVDYNAQVLKAVAAKTTLDAMDYGSYVPLENSELITAVVTFAANGMVTGVNTQMLTDYNGALLSDTPQVATVDPDTGVTGNTNVSNFDQAGNLVVPMRLVDPETGQPSSAENAVLRPTVVSDGTANEVMNIRTRVERTNAAAAALKKARDENAVTSVQDVYNDAYARAQAEADYYNQEWARVLSDSTNQNDTADDADTADVDESTPFSIASRNAAYTTEANKRFTEEQTLRAAVLAREGATDAVVAAFSSPQSFYEQLVARRQALQVTADRAVTAASTSGPPSESVVDAAADAAKALADAQEARDNLVGLFADADDPSVALLNELVKTGGDDGQALVDAISATYETAAGAADAAREVVAELTGEGGAVSVNTADIESLDGRVTVNEGAILTNAGNITMNAAGILANRTDIDTNAGDIMMNAGNIMDNRGMIETNTMGISGNSGRIDAAESMISQNQGNISGNTAMIGELSESLEVVRAGVAASMALAGMPAINGRGISIGVGSFDGESAFAIGFQIQNDATSFKVGLTSGGGATGASAGVGFQF